MWLPILFISWEYPPGAILLTNVPGLLYYSSAVVNAVWVIEKAQVLPIIKVIYLSFLLTLWYLVNS